MATQVIMPQLGESVVEGTVGRWLVTEGQPVKEYDPLLAVTTDKVDTEIPSPASGIVLKIHVAEGQTVAAGTLLAVIGEEGEALADLPTGGQRPAPAEAGVTEPAQPGSVPSATPLAQRMAAEHALDLSRVTGTGPGGRITKEDVEALLTGDGETDPAHIERTWPGQGTARRPSGFISPAVARLAAEFDVDLSQVIGTGEGGRITKKDVQAYIAAPVPRGERTAAGDRDEVPPWEQPGTGSLFKPTEEMVTTVEADSEQAGVPTTPAGRSTSVPARIEPAQVGFDSESVSLSPIRRAIARHMIESKRTSAHVTTVMEADMTRLVQARQRLRDDFERQGTKLTFTPFFVQAIIAGIKAVPEANSTLRDDTLLVHRRIHIGMAVAVTDGLIVPIIRNADEKSLLGLARAVNELAERARGRRLNPDEVQGGTFTLTNHGTAGSLFATPIISQPQAGILGVGAIQKRPVVVSRGDSLLPDAEDFIAIRPMAYLSFTFDHRILDGAGADRFLATVKQFLEFYTL